MVSLITALVVALVAALVLTRVADVKQAFSFFNSIKDELDDQFRKGVDETQLPKGVTMGAVLDLRHMFHSVINSASSRELKQLHEFPIWPVVRGILFEDVKDDSIGNDSPSGLVEKVVIWKSSHVLPVRSPKEEESERTALLNVVDMFKTEVLHTRDGVNTCKGDGLGFNLLLIECGDENGAFDASASVPTIDNERYMIYASPKKELVIRISSQFALRRAMTSLAQLLMAECDHMQSRSSFLIVDQPAFAYRGLLLDTAREFYQVETILNLVKLMAMIKLNALHWHFADDQSYGLESSVIPEITESTYWEDVNNSKTYSLKDVERIVQEGKRWGVRIVPELDMPSHTGGWHRAQGLLAECPQFACNTAWGLTMHPYSNRSWEIIQAILTEITTVFPDPLIHLGGDEVSEGCWKEDTSVNKVSPNRDAHWSFFEQKLNKMIHDHTQIKHQKETIRWEDCRRFYENGVVVTPKTKKVTFHLWQWWEDFSWVEKELAKGNTRIISSLGWYLDGYCLSWDDCYRQNPLGRIPNLARRWKDDKEAIYGLEACPWELSERNLNSENLWVRFMSVAEQMWSSSEFGLLTHRPIKRMSVPFVGNRTRERIVDTCLWASRDLTLFPTEMCTSKMMARREPITKDKAYRKRLKEREEMICKRIATNPPLPCTTHNCREGDHREQPFVNEHNEEQAPTLVETS